MITSIMRGMAIPTERLQRPQLLAPRHHCSTPLDRYPVEFKQQLHGAQCRLPADINAEIIGNDVL
jgi:hypothetical protein